MTPERLAEIRANQARRSVSANSPNPHDLMRELSELLAEVDRLAAVSDAFKLAAADLAQVGIAEREALRKSLAALAGAEALWRHAECCVTGTGCTHDSDGECADSLLSHATDLVDRGWLGRVS